MVPQCIWLLSLNVQRSQPQSVSRILFTLQGQLACVLSSLLLDLRDWRINSPFYLLNNLMKSHSTLSIAVTFFQRHD